MTWELKRTKQFKFCPWKVLTNPYDISGGYRVDLHRQLEDTIAERIRLEEGAAMACHHSEIGKEEYCVS